MRQPYLKACLRHLRSYGPVRPWAICCLGLLGFALSATAQAPTPSPDAPPATPPATDPLHAVPRTPMPEHPAPSRIPENAIPALGLETSGAWQWVHDDQTKGASNGESHYPIFPDGRNGAPGRQFVTWYFGNGGERYHLTFGKDPNATHFVYEANVYLVDPPQVAAVEMDMNQVIADGRTVIYGVQCAVKSKSWEYTYVDSGGTHWRPSNIACNPQSWGTKKWHKIQIASHRDDGGNVTYDWISFDGVYSDFENATAYSAQSLGWPIGELLLNFQIDGSHKNGVMDTYLNSLAVYRW